MSILYYVEDQKKQNSRIYWAGAYISFGVSFIALEILALIFNVTPANVPFQERFRLLIVIIYLCAGLIGGFLVAAKSSVSWQQGGIVSGVMAYVIEQIVHAVLYGWNSVGDVFTMFAMIGGSLIGAAIYEYTDIKNYPALKGLEVKGR